MTTLPPPIEMIRRLVAIPSISNASPALDQSNRPVAEQLAAWLEPLGFQCQLIPLAAQPHKCNLIATAGPAGDGGLVLAGHLDTVPFDAGAWTADPFTGALTDDRIVGLGSADMKGFLALAATAATRLDLAKLTAPLILLGTADEETGMDGAKALAASGLPGARHAVIGEPTSMRPVHAHKGILMEAIHVHGRAGHSSDPARGANAIDAMARVLGGLTDLRGELARETGDPAFAVRHATLNPGHICGGDAPNRIPAHCELHVDLRFLPGMGIDALRTRLHDAVARALEGDTCTWHCEPLFDGTPAYRCEATADIVRAAAELTGTDAHAVDFATEAGYFGELGIETVVLGPGDISVAHQPDEFLRLDRIDPTIDLIERLIRRFCLPAA